jgi:hypothetical protein
MPIKINGDTYYRTAEAARTAGVTKSTLLRWVDDGIIKDASLRDRRGWRLFTEDDIKSIEDEASTVGRGKVVMVNHDGKGQAEINGDIEEAGIKIRVDGSHLTEALKACGRMVEVKLTKPYSPILLTLDGYQLLIMPVVTQEATEQQKGDSEAKQAHMEAQQAEPTTTDKVAAVVAEAEAIAAKVAQKPKRRHKAKEPVAVARNYPLSRNCPNDAGTVADRQKNSLIR